MTDIDKYLEASTRPNTRRSYASATKHFEEDWGGHLPASGETVARYLAHFAGELAINTLRHRLVALGQWHAAHGFADPTRTPVVRRVLKGIQALHPAMEKRAAPLQLTQLGQVADWLQAAATTAISSAERLRHQRDRALVLLGFWRGFRSDELRRLQVEHLQLVPGHGMTCFLGHTKGDRQNAGTTFKIPALSRWCPVAATTAWVAAADLTEGPLFRRIDRWAALSVDGLHPNSVIRLLRRVFADAGLDAPEAYSSHSLRRGFAGWANANGWDVKTLMEYVGWKDVHSAMRYIDGADAFARLRIESDLPVLLPAPDRAGTAG